MTNEKHFPKTISQWEFDFGLFTNLPRIIVARDFSPNSKEVSYLPWQNTYPNLKTSCHIKLKFFLWTKLLENLLLAKYLKFVDAPLKSRQLKSRTSSTIFGLDNIFRSLIINQRCQLHGSMILPPCDVWRQSCSARCTALIWSPVLENKFCFQACSDSYLFFFGIFLIFIAWIISISVNCHLNVKLLALWLSLPPTKTSLQTLICSLTRKRLLAQVRVTSDTAGVFIPLQIKISVFNFFQNGKRY